VYRNKKSDTTYRYTPKRSITACLSNKNRCTRKVWRYQRGNKEP